MAIDLGRSTSDKGIDAAISRLLATLVVAFTLGCAGFVAAPRADLSFDRWVQNFWPAAKAAGISRPIYDAAFRGVTPDPDVLEKANNQPEFVTPLWQYVVTRVSEKRILAGREMLDRYRPLLDRIEARYGVDRHIVVAVWGMESYLRRSALRSGDKERGAFAGDACLWRQEPRQVRPAATHRGAEDPAARRYLARGLTGSWAGAMGHTQFIPTTYEAYAVDFDGDGQRDIWNSPADALASTANYLRRPAGCPGGPGATRSCYRRVSTASSPGTASRARSASGWVSASSARAATAFRAGRQGVLMTPAGADGPAFLMLRNHYVIKRYNNSTAYSLAVGHLADRLRGGATSRALGRTANGR